MKYLFLVLAIFLISCDPDEEQRTTCYSYINNSNQDISMEMYDYNSGQFVTEIGTFNSDGQGLLDTKCKSDKDVRGPVYVYRFDSIVIKFDNSKKLTYLWRFGEVGDPIFYSDSYEREGNTSNFSYTFTEEDYNNAVPY